MKCKNCGAELNNGKCEYCGSVFMEDMRYILPKIDPEKMEALIKESQRNINFHRVWVCTKN